jgi:hypothetical protein
LAPIFEALRSFSGGNAVEVPVVEVSCSSDGLNEVLYENVVRLLRRRLDDHAGAYARVGIRLRIVRRRLLLPGVFDAS